MIDGYWIDMRKSDTLYVNETILNKGLSEHVSEVKVKVVVIDLLERIKLL